MSEKPTIQFLLSKEQQQADYPEIRKLAGAEFVPQPHDICGHVMPFVIPDTRPMEVIAFALLRKLTNYKLREAYRQTSEIFRWDKDLEGVLNLGDWQAFNATPEQIAACALVALGLAAVEESR